MTTIELQEIKAKWETLTPLERNAVTQKMQDYIAELEEQLTERNELKANLAERFKNMQLTLQRNFSVAPFD